MTTPFDLNLYTMNSSRPNAPNGSTTTATGATAGGDAASAATGEPSLLEYYVDVRSGMLACWRDAGPVERIYSSLGPSIDLPLGSDRDRSRSTPAAPDRSLTCSAHTQKYLHLLDLLLTAECPLLVAGASGVGKSAFLEVRTQKCALVSFRFRLLYVLFSHF